MNASEIPQWLSGVEPVIERGLAFYAGLPQEQRIWVWICAVLAISLLVAGIIAGLIVIVKGLNRLLQSRRKPYEGWKPIRFFTCMWAGMAIWAGITSIQLRSDNTAGWSVLLSAAIIGFACLGWFMVRRLDILRATAALATNSAFGVIIAPIIINLGLLIIIGVILLIGFSIWSSLQPQRIYVVNR